MSILNTSETFKRLRNRYRLVVMNDDTYQELVTFKLDRLSVYIVMSATFLILVSLTVALIVFTPMKYYIPGYGSRNSETAFKLLKIRTDSLEQAVHYKDQYLDGIKKVLNGNSPSSLDTIVIKIPKTDVSND
ncbi:hypothetical protein [Parasediminibacterium sp. JCM 36343]|uniref:hypothetical protein n=1 Tax=Parasediminibacterium sp. JCM 36343 TaxID=3374279 RepID=UPI0039784F7C